MSTDPAVMGGVHVDWRWHLSKLHSELPRKRVQASDEFVGRLIRYHRSLARRPARRGARQADDNFADIAQAVQIYDADGEQRCLIEALVLADQPVDEIARVTGLPAEVVTAYEATFYDVRVRRNYPAFILGVLLPTAYADYPHDVRHTVWKLLAYQSGVAALNAFRNPPPASAGEVAR